MNMDNNYSRIRFVWNKNRRKVWAEIARYLQKYIKKDSNTLDLGAGYCDFINFIKAKKKYALDKCIDPRKFSSEEVIPIFGDFSLIKDEIKENSLDVVFASNFFEHLKEKEMDKCIELIKNKLVDGGLLIIIQPNYKFCYKNYFDDYTHVKAWTDIGLKDYLKNKGFLIRQVNPRFLPFSMKSVLPKIRLLVRLYLISPIKPFASQMLIIAKNKK